MFVLTKSRNAAVCKTISVFVHLCAYRSISILSCRGSKSLKNDVGQLGGIQTQYLAPSGAAVITEVMALNCKSLRSLAQIIEPFVQLNQKRKVKPNLLSKRFN